jgi:hypothetical protein
VFGLKIGIRFWSMFSSVQYAGHRRPLRHSGGEKGQRSIRIDLNMKGPISGESRGVESTVAVGSG